MKNTNTNLSFFLPNEDIEDDGNRILEESPNSRWNKLDSEIYVQKLVDFDTTYLAIDTEKGTEIAWNEMIFKKDNSIQNRFEDVKTLSSIYDKLKYVLDFLIKVDHLNILKFYDHWFINDDLEAKIVVITEYSTAGSLRKALEVAKTNNIKVKDQSYKRWINQIVYAFKYLHSEKISIFQGHINSETIFIQNNGVIKLAPTLLLLNGVCEITKSFIKISTTFNSNLTVEKLLNLTSDIVIKDLHAIGRLAVEIFNSNLKPKTLTSPMKPRSYSYLQNTFDILLNMINDDEIYEHNLSEDDLQKDFINKCYTNDKQNPKVDSIWYHPFINTIYSLKVLSVYSILSYFQDKAKIKTKLGSSSSLSKMTNRIFTSEDISNRSNNLKPSSSSSSLSKEKRKVSLTFLSNFNNLSLPQNFFSILDDIRYGLYPRIFKDIELRDLTPPTNSSLNNLLQRKQFVDRRCSILDMNNYLFNDSYNEDDQSVFDPEITLTNLNEMPSRDKQIEKCFLKASIETRRIESKKCSIRKDHSLKTIELIINLKFNDNSTRMLECNFPMKFLEYFQVDYCNVDNTTQERVNTNNLFMNANLNDEQDLFSSSNALEEQSLESKIMNICNHLSNELLDFGLINQLDHSVVSELLFDTINKSLIS